MPVASKGSHRGTGKPVPQTWPLGATQLWRLKLARMLFARNAGQPVELHATVARFCSPEISHGISFARDLAKSL